MPTGRIVYVGKARGLRSRVGSYFRADQVQPKVQALVRVVAGIEVTVTNSDTEALLLEHNLIKTHRPRFNVILRDDKSFPYVHLSAHEYPRLSFYRGSRKLPGRLFGPYPSASAVHETLNQLHKLFRLRSCKDTFFANRSRPCLEYQIGRCSAPCTGLIDAAAYARDVESVAMVLDGRTRDVTAHLGAEMDRAAERLDFERAALLRDQLAAMTDVQARQVMTRARAGMDTDVIAVAEAGGEFCVALMFVRGGQVLGTSTFHPRAPISDAPEVLAAFLAQHYLERDAPPRIYLSHAVEDTETLARASFTARSGRQVRIAAARRGYPQRWVALACRMRSTHCRCARRRRPASPGSSRNCGSFSGSTARSSGSSASTSATRRVRRRTHPASCSRPKARSSRITGATTSKTSSAVTTTAHCARRLWRRYGGASRRRCRCPISC